MKPWQLVIVVIALLATGYSVFSGITRESGITLPDSKVFADVQTGALYRIDSSETVVVPGRSPSSGERVLWPVIEREDGWFLSNRYLEGAQRNTLASEAEAIDLETGQISVTTGPESIRYRR
ncbi:MAG: hypothetical protein AAGB51_00045 [Planctomycetota bacterium]